MKCTQLFFLFLVLFYQTFSHAFIPPLKNILDTAFRDRSYKSFPFKYVFKHEIKGTQQISFKENIYHYLNRTFSEIEYNGSKFVFGVSQPRYESAGISIERKSTVLLNYLILSQASEWQAILLRERFINYEQMDTFKAHYTLEGNPEEWNTNKKYIKHESISYSPFWQGYAIQVIGMEDRNNKRSLFFGKNPDQGLLRIDWRYQNKKKILAWNLESHKIYSQHGQLPRRMTLVKNGKIVVQSQLLGTQSIPQTEFERLVIRQKQNVGNISQISQALKELYTYR